MAQVILYTASLIYLSDRLREKHINNEKSYLMSIISNTCYI